ncbi:MAG TPA: hypothetical protein VLD16_06860 [Gaiellaceae bacterium]|nr:hypothetical protein [Gaiellaceae bacterium]
MLRSAALVAAIALVAAVGASAETVARGTSFGELAVGVNGTPSVAYVHGSTLVLASRTAPNRWARAEAASVPTGSSVMAFAIGARGPVLLVGSADSRRLFLVRRRSVGWQTVVVASVPARYRLGWPGLALDARGLPVVSYTRWDGPTLKSRLLLDRIDANGRIQTRRITLEGFPKSYIPPPATPVLFGDKAHVIESYGYKGVVGTIEWYPDKKTWTGLGLDAGLGDWPLGPVLAGVRQGVLHAAWTESLLTMDLTAAPVALASRRHFASTSYVLDRALATALVLPSTGPEVAANQWVDSGDLGLQGDADVWAGTIIRGATHVEVDGWLAGLALAPKGGRDLLLGGRDGLRWFRVPHVLTTSVSLDAVDDGTDVSLSGRVRGAATGSVTIYRERPGEPRTAVGKAALSGGEFSFTDRPPLRPLTYRAVYTDPQTGLPYAALLRNPVGAS